MFTLTSKNAAISGAVRCSTSAMRKMFRRFGSSRWRKSDRRSATSAWAVASSGVGAGVPTDRQANAHSLRRVRARLRRKLRATVLAIPRSQARSAKGPARSDQRRYAARKTSWTASSRWSRGTACSASVREIRRRLRRNAASKWSRSPTVEETIEPSRTCHPFGSGAQLRIGYLRRCAESRYAAVARPTFPSQPKTDSGSTSPSCSAAHGATASSVAKMVWG